MKTIKLLTALIAALLFVSCEEYNITTTINSDGSCSREMNYKETSHTTPQWHGGDKVYSLPIIEGADYGDTSKEEYNLESFDTNKVVRKFKEYASVEEMCNDWISFTPENFESTAKGGLKKKFMWFYTYYTFTETFNNYSHILNVPADRYSLSDDMISFWLTGKPELAQGLAGIDAIDKLSPIETKFNKWITACFYSELIDIFINNYESITDAPISKEQFIANKDSVLAFIDKSGIVIFDLKGKNDPINDYYKTDKYDSENHKQWEIYNSVRYLEEKYMLIFTTKYNFKLVMPGKIESVSVGTIDNNTAQYTIQAKAFAYKDYTFSATSRKTNAWAFVISALIIAVAIGSSVALKKQKA